MTLGLLGLTKNHKFPCKSLGKIQNAIAVWLTSTSINLDTAVRVAVAHVFPNDLQGNLWFLVNPDKSNVNLKII